MSTALDDTLIMEHSAGRSDAIFGANCGGPVSADSDSLEAAIAAQPAAGNVASFAQNKDLCAFYDQLVQTDPAAAAANTDALAQVAAPAAAGAQQQRNQPSRFESGAAVHKPDSLAAALLDPTTNLGSRIRRSGLSSFTPAEQQLLLSALQQEVQGSLFPPAPSLVGGRGVGGSPRGSPGGDSLGGRPRRSTHRKSASFSAAVAAGYPRSRSYPSEGDETSARTPHQHLVSSGGRHNSEPDVAAMMETGGDGGAGAGGRQHSPGLRSRRGLPDLHQVRGGAGATGAATGPGGLPIRPSPSGKRDAEGNLLATTTPGPCGTHLPRGALARGVGGGGSGGAGLGEGGIHLSLSPEAVLAVELSKMGVSPAVIVAATGADLTGQFMGAGLMDGGAQWGGMNASLTGGLMGAEGSKRHAGAGSRGAYRGMDSPPKGSSRSGSGMSGQQQQQQQQQQQNQNSGSGFSVDAEGEEAGEGKNDHSNDGPLVFKTGGGGGECGSPRAGNAAGNCNTNLGYSTKPRSVAERLRREKITVRLQTLKEVLPKMDAKTDTSAMLEDAVVYIQSLQARCKALERQNGALTQQLKDYGVTPVVNHHSFML
ncbi:hypothetical protein CLOM_g5790 [Closterium sp. NIES-68]|nr:hypothetical protein CLOM_g5790 [Closterium sp. NIES-68]GJP73845.1 hypothetical protein CLOP_g4521 [Closterium sp. NIES-67]